MIYYLIDSLFNWINYYTRSKNKYILTTVERYILYWFLYKSISLYGIFFCIPQIQNKVLPQNYNVHKEVFLKIIISGYIFKFMKNYNNKLKSHSILQISKTITIENLFDAIKNYFIINVLKYNYLNSTYYYIIKTLIYYKFNYTYIKTSPEDAKYIIKTVSQEKTFDKIYTLEVMNAFDTLINKELFIKLKFYTFIVFLNLILVFSYLNQLYKTYVLLFLVILQLIKKNSYIFRCSLYIYAMDYLDIYPFIILIFCLLESHLHIFLKNLIFYIKHYKKIQTYISNESWKIYIE